MSLFFTYQDPLLTEKDFNGWGLSASSVRPIRPHEETFRVRINPKVPVYTFHVTSYASSAGSPGSIEIFRGDASRPLQVIPLDPNAFLADEVPVFFNVQDINFDSFSDIGAVAAGGALWGSYQYWIFDAKTGKFMAAPITKEFRQISFNAIEFDAQKRQIVAHNLLGAVGSMRNAYQFRNGHLRLLKEVTQENRAQDAGLLKQTDQQIIHCLVTTKAYSSESVRTTYEELDRECERL